MSSRTAATPEPLSPRRLALVLAAGMAYAGLSHWMMVYHPTAPWAVAVLLGPLWLTAIALAGSRLGRVGIVAAVAAGLALVLLVWRGAVGDPDRLYVFQHAAINAVLLAWFGGSLVGEGPSLIGQFAARVHPLTPAMRRYTRSVTMVWTGYFAAMVPLSLAVYAWLPFDAWSLLANIVSPLAIGGIFIGEYLLRYRLHPEFERTRLIDAVRAFYGSVK